MKAKVETVESESYSEEVRSEVSNIIRTRLEGFISPLHRAAYALDPEFQGRRKSPKIQEAFESVCGKILSPFEKEKAILGLFAFNDKEGAFGRATSLSLASQMAGWDWWNQLGGEWPELQRVAVTVLAMVSGAGECERNWSALDFLHNKKRNRMSSKRAEDLCFVYYNNKLVEKLKKPPPFVKWHVGELSFFDDSDAEEGEEGEEEDEEEEEGGGEEEGEEGEEEEEEDDEEGEDEEMMGGQEWYDTYDST